MMSKLRQKSAHNTFYYGCNKLTTQGTCVLEVLGRVSALSALVMRLGGHSFTASTNQSEASRTSFSVMICGLAYSS